jgi:hypothetical protein
VTLKQRLAQKVLVFRQSEMRALGFFICDSWLCTQAISASALYAVYKGLYLAITATMHPFFKLIQQEAYFNKFLLLQKIAGLVTLSISPAAVET